MALQNKAGEKRVSNEITPFVRQQVRWALSRYRANHRVGVPRLLNEIIDALGEAISNELTTQDIYNFLDNGRETRAHKVLLFLSFLQQQAPDYVSAVSFDQFGITTADFIQAYSDGLNHKRKGPDQFGLLNDFETELFFSAKKEGSLDDAWMERGHQYGFEGVRFTVFAIRFPGAGEHLLFHSFNVYLSSQYFDVDRVAPSNNEKVESAFNVSSLEATIEALENIVFSEKIPISEKSHGLIVNGNSAEAHDGTRPLMLMRRGVEPGVFFDQCYIRKFESGPYVGQPGISMSRHLYMGDENSFASRKIDMFPMASLDQLLDGYFENSEGNSEYSSLYLPFKSKSLQEFIDRFDWGNV